MAEENDAQPMEIQVEDRNILSSILCHFGRRAIEVTRVLSMAQPQPLETESQMSRSNFPTSVSIPNISVSGSVTFVSNVVLEISRSLKSGLYEVLVDIPVSFAPNLLYEFSNVASVKISPLFRKAC